MIETTVQLTAEQLDLIAEAVEYYAHVKPHLAHLVHYWLPYEAYNHVYYRHSDDRKVTRAQAMMRDSDGDFLDDIKRGYSHYKHLNDVGRIMITEYARRIEEIGGLAYQKLIHG